MSDSSDFGNSFVGVKLIIDDRMWEIVQAIKGDSGAEDDVFFTISSEDGEMSEIHYEDYDDGRIINDTYLNLMEIEYPDGEPHSVTIRREMEDQDG